MKSILPKLKIVTASIFTLGLLCSFNIQAESFDEKDALIQRQLNANPKALTKYVAIKNKIIESFKKFLDKCDKHTYKHHIEHITKHIQELQCAIQDPELASVRPMLENLHAKLAELVALLRSYIGSKNATLLGIQIKAGGYESLLSQEVSAGQDSSQVLEVLKYRMARK